MYDVTSYSTRHDLSGELDGHSSPALRIGPARRYKRVALALLLAFSGCQVRPPAGSAQYPEYMRFPETEIRMALDAFRKSTAKGGMVQVARDIRTCQGTLAPATPQDLVRQCFAFETAALQVTTAHDERMGSAPLPGLSRSEFDRRLDRYCTRMGITGPSCPAARVSMQKQVAYWIVH